MSDTVTCEAYLKLFRERGGVQIQLVDEDEQNHRQFWPTLRASYIRICINVCLNEQTIPGTTIPRYTASSRGGKNSLKQQYKLFNLMKENSWLYMGYQEVVSGKVEQSGAWPWPSSAFWHVTLSQYD